MVFCILAIVALGLAAHMTRPTRADFEQMVEDAVRSRIAATELEQTDDIGNAFVLAGCKLRTTQCVDLLMATVHVDIQRGLLTTSLDYEGLKRRGHCIGAFGRFWCKGDKDL
jgi:hypothetical protein